MPVDDIVFRVLSGLVIGFTIGLSGVGGGVLIMPILVSIFGLSPSLAVGTASFYTVLTKMYATFEHFRKKTIDKKVGLLFLSSAIPGALIASLLINLLVHRYQSSPHTLASIQDILRWIIIGVMAISSTLIFFDTFRKEQPEKTQKFSPKKKKLIGVVFGFVVGLLLGATSIGGGVLVIPILILFFRLSGSATVGTSIFIAVILSLVATIIYGKSGQIDFPTGILMFMGSTIGVYLGAKLCVKSSERVLKFTLFLLITISMGLMLVGQRSH